MVSSESCLPGGQCSSTAETRDGGPTSFETEPIIRYFLSHLDVLPQQNDPNTWTNHVGPTLPPETMNPNAESLISQQSHTTAARTQSLPHFPKFVCSHGLVTANISPLQTLRRDLELRCPKRKGSLWLCWGEERSRARALCETMLGRPLSADSLLRRSAVDWTLVWRRSNGIVETRPVWLVQKTSSFEQDDVGARTESSSDSLACSMEAFEPFFGMRTFRECYGKTGKITFRYHSYDSSSESHILIVERSPDCGDILRKRVSRLSQAKRILIS